MARKPTLKQKAFVKKFIENKGNGTLAAMDVYDVKNYNTAHAISSENLQKPTIQREIEQALERTGLNDEYISELLREATVAGIGQKATNSDTLRGIEMMLKVKGAFPDRMHKSAHLRIDYRQELEKKSVKEIEEELRRVEAKTRELLEDIST